MSREVRTKKGRLVGKIDEQKSILSIKDGSKFMQIEVPQSGIRLWFTSNDGLTEEIFIAASAKPLLA